MKELWKEYGKTLNIILVAAALLLLILMAWQRIGNEVRKPAAGEDTGSRVDEKMLQNMHMRENPVITYEPERILTVQEKRETASLFQAVDADGTVLDTEIIRISDQNGEEVEDIFEKPGIYFIAVKAEDACQKQTVCSFRIPVNGGGI